MNTTYGPVTVVGLTPTTAGTLVRVSLQQQEHHSDYTLEDCLAGKATQFPHLALRKTVTRMPPREAQALREGLEVPGHLVRTLHASPQFKGHLPAFTGGFATCAYHKSFLPDVDLRDTPTP